MVEECLEPGCPYPATKDDEGHWVDAVDFDGADVQLYLDKYTCAAGHRYHLVNESKTRMVV